MATRSRLHRKVVVVLDIGSSSSRPVGDGAEYIRDEEVILTLVDR